VLSPIPTATAAHAISNVGVRRSPVTIAAATTPKMGWVRKNAARPLGRYRFRSQRFASRPE